MTKPLQYSCIKKQEYPPSLLEFNKILDKISHEDKIGHLFIVDIKFHNKNPKTMLFNEIYPPIFENKKMEPSERSTLQLMSIFVRDEGKDKIVFRTLPKLIQYWERKKIISLYAEDLYFFLKKGQGGY